MDNYTFTPEERQFFERQQTQVQAAVNALNTALSLLVAQRKLPGAWRINQDGSGIERVERVGVPGGGGDVGNG